VREGKKKKCRDLDQQHTWGGECRLAWKKTSKEKKTTRKGDTEKKYKPPAGCKQGDRRRKLKLGN